MPLSIAQLKELEKSIADYQGFEIETLRRLEERFMRAVANAFPAICEELERRQKGLEEFGLQMLAAHDLMKEMEAREAKWQAFAQACVEEEGFMNAAEFMPDCKWKDELTPGLKP